MDNQFQRIHVAEVIRNSWLFPRHISKIYLQSALAKARPSVHGVLVDIGCGLRPYESLFSDRITKYIGLDLPAVGFNARPDIICDASYLPLEKGTADTVLATELMEHLPNPDQFLSEVARIIRPSGTLILSAPFLYPLHEEPRDFYRFTSHGLRYLLERNGFSLDEIWLRGGIWSVMLGSCVTESLYDLFNPLGANNRRKNNRILLALVLPFCALLQMVGYMLDRFASSPKYTLGYVLVALRKS